MNRLSRFARAAWLLIACLAQPIVWADQAVNSRSDKPNVIIINIDDLGYSDISPFGGMVKTEFLDRLAAAGMKLTSHYAAPVCSPSRAAMMTGCYPKRVLPIPGVLFPAAEVGLHPQEITVADLLQDVGYATACIGKWHLGDQAEFLPTRQGFDYYFGIPYSNDMGLRAEGSKSNPGEPILPTPTKGAQSINPAVTDRTTGLKGDAQPPLPLLENDKVIERVKAAEQHTLTRRYTERAVSFIQEHHQQPFFLYLPHSAVHWPLYPHQDYVGSSRVGLQKDWVLEVDWSVGQIMKAVEEFNLESNTLLIFTSDNGGPENHGASNAPLRGAKGSTLEGGMRVCTIVRWPGRIPAGSTTAEITSHMDWLPTLASIAGADYPADRKLDGIDLLALLTQQPKAVGHELFFFYRGFDLEAVRQGPWKLHLAKQELYNLDNDIGESQNLLDQHGEIVAELKSRASEMIRDLGDTTEHAPGVRQLGRVAQAKPLIGKDGTVRADAVGPSNHFP